MTNEDSAVALAKIQTTADDLMRARTQSDRNHAQTATEIKKMAQGINDVKLDVAVLKTQHANFWKGVTILGAVVTTIAAVIGWAVSQISVWMKG